MKPKDLSWRVVSIETLMSTARTWPSWQNAATTCRAWVELSDPLHEVKTAVNSLVPLTPGMQH